MPPKAGKGKAVKTVGSATAAESDLVKLRKKHAVFAPTLDGRTLIERYRHMWGKETKAHPKTRALSAFGEGGPDKYPFFVAYFYCGLCPPFSDFFNDIMYTYGFHLLDFSPNAITCMSVFAHLCENFAGFAPSTALFRHYFVPRIETGDALTGSVTWISRGWNSDIYPGGLYRRKWEEWRSEWCWIQEKDPQSFLRASEGETDPWQQLEQPRPSGREAHNCYHQDSSSEGCRAHNRDDRRRFPPSPHRPSA